MLAKWLGAALCVVGVVGSSVAAEKKFWVGNFVVETDRDPMDDRTNYFASLSVSNAMIIVRCLRGEQNVLLVSPAEGHEGDSASVKARVDSAEVVDYSGEVLATRGIMTSVQFGDADLITKLGGGKRLAVRLGLNDVERTYTFDMKNSKGMADGVAAACKPPS